MADKPINTQHALKQMGNRPIPYTDVNEAKRIRPIKGLWTPAQMKQQVKRIEKAFLEFGQHCDFLFQMDADVGPSGGDNSGKYWDVYSKLDKANKEIMQALYAAKRVKHPD